MLPTIDFGPLHLHTYGLMVGLAVIVIAMVSFHRLRQLEVPASIILRGGAPIFLGGTVVGFAVYYLSRLPHLIRTGTWG